MSKWRLHGGGVSKMRLRGGGVSCSEGHMEVEYHCGGEV